MAEYLKKDATYEISKNSNKESVMRPNISTTNLLQKDVRTAIKNCLCSLVLCSQPWKFVVVRERNRALAGQL